MTDESLSDKMWKHSSMIDGCHAVYFDKSIELIKESVKKLKTNIDSNYGIHKMCAIQAKKEIDKIFGDKLI